MHKILIIEDDPSYSVLLNRLFSEEDFEVFTASSGEDGLELVKNKVPELVLLDIRMPKMDGKEVLKRIRSMENGSEIKVVFLTNLEADKDILEHTLKDKNTFYILKSDVGFEELKGKVKNLL